MNIAPHRFSTSRKKITAALVLALAFLLSACGAEVSTVLNLDGDNKGSRIITAKVSKDDMKYVEGGATALESSIRKHLPEQLVFDGLSAKDEATQVIFTLNFESEKDYVDKVTALLATSESEITPVVEIVLENSTFLSGISIDENFGSKDLLGWMPASLVADGVLEKEQQSGVFGSSGQTEINYNGKSFTSGEQARVSDMEDNGFSALKLETTVLPDGTFIQSVAYEMEASKDNALGLKLTDFFKKATPSTGTFTKITSDNTYNNSWNITFPAADLEELNSLTNQALNSSDTKYMLEDAPTPSNPTLFRTVFNSSIDCASICSPGSGNVRQTVMAPSAWKLVDESKTAATHSENPDVTSAVVTGKEASITFEHSTPLQSITVETSIGLNGDVTQKFEFVISSENVGLVGDGFEKLLAPPTDIGTFATQNGKDQTTYTVAVTASDEAEYNTKIQGYIPGAALTTHSPDGWHIWPEYTIVQQLPLANSLARGGVTEGVKTTLDLPSMHKFTSASQAGVEVSGNKLSASGLDAAQYMQAAAAGPTVSGIVVLSIMSALLLAAVILALVFRRRIIVMTQKIWAKRVDVTAASSKFATTMVQAGAAAGAAASTLAAAGTASAANTEDLRPHSEKFTEADLL